MLRKLRIILSLFFFIAITLLVLDFTGTLHRYLAWMAKIQLLPAILATNLIVVVALLAITLIMGRIYCSVICPLGIYQDVVAWLSRKLFCKGRRKYNHIEKPVVHNAIRGSFLALFIILMVCGMLGVASLIAPYSSFARMVQTLLQPLYIMANNVLAGIAEKADSYAFYEVDVWMHSGAVLTITLVTWLIISFMAARWGRLYCNSICPVGSLLGVLSRFSWLKPRIKDDKCIHCGLCERGCKAQAIKVTREGTVIDYTRCVDCFDCLDVCKHGALKFLVPSSKFKVQRINNPQPARPKGALARARTAAALSYSRHYRQELAQHWHRQARRWTEAMPSYKTRLSPKDRRLSCHREHAVPISLRSIVQRASYASLNVQMMCCDPQQT